MDKRNFLIGIYLAANLWFWPDTGFGQQVKDVPEAFQALNPEPKIITISNKIKVPTDSGHLQGVQAIENNGTTKLLISGSSQAQAYILQVDLATKKADRLIPLMNDPFRHAGGMQASEDYLVVGIEDNFLKNVAKVCLYSYQNSNLFNAQPSITIDRTGEVERPTAGATGLLAMDDDYLMVVGNWDSRNWDFYSIDPEKNEQRMIESFEAPDDWAGYQSINLIMDQQAIYAIGFYKKDSSGYADLILVSKLVTIELIMKKVYSKAFNCANGVDFGAAAGLQVDKEGNLHVWGTQRDALEQIVVNRFSQQ